MDLRAHLNAELLSQRQSAFDDLSPVQNGLEQIVDDGHLGSHNGESQAVSQTDISLEHFNGLFCREISVAEDMRVDPVAILDRNDLIFVAKPEPVLYPLICRIRIVLDMRVSQDLNSVSAHIMAVFKAVLKSLRQTEFCRVAVQGHTALWSFSVIFVHIQSLLSQDAQRRRELNINSVCAVSKYYFMGF